MRVMRSVSYAVLATLIAVWGLVLAQEPAPRPSTSAQATAPDDRAAADSDVPAAASDAEDAGTEDSDVTTSAADADSAAVPGSRPSKDAAAAPATPPADRKPASATGSPQRFEPTEKVRPDFDVAFPVDI